MADDADRRVAHISGERDRFGPPRYSRRLFRTEKGRPHSVEQRIRVAGACQDLAGAQIFGPQREWQVGRCRPDCIQSCQLSDAVARHVLCAGVGVQGGGQAPDQLQCGCPVHS